MTALVLMAASGCLAVAGDRILARDMARLWPEFAAVGGETALGYAPAPGARRVFSTAELARLAARFGLEAPAKAVCFERPMTALTEERALEAMRVSLDMPEARIEIVELSRYPVPQGELRFPRARLRAPGPAAQPESPVLWRGEVVYGDGRRFAVWARVKVRAPLRRVRAATVLKAGETVRPEQLAVEEAEGFPVAGREAETMDQVAGRRPRRTIPAGSAVPLALLDSPADVERGDEVRVTVKGAARLELAARAETAGSAGEMVTVRNPESRRTFRARVSGKGEVEVDTGGRP